MFLLSYKCKKLYVEWVFQVKDRMMLKLKEHLSQTFENLSNPMVRRDHSGMIRTLLIQKILNGR